MSTYEGLKNCTETVGPLVTDLERHKVLSGFFMHNGIRNLRIFHRDVFNPGILTSTGKEQRNYDC